MRSGWRGDFEPPPLQCRYGSLFVTDGASKGGVAMIHDHHQEALTGPDPVRSDDLALKRTKNS